MQRTRVILGRFLRQSDPKQLSFDPKSALLMEGETIATRLTPEEAQTLERQGVPVEDFGEALVIPGLNDLHTHAPQYAFRGTGMDLELLDWLEKYTFPEEGRYAEEAYARKAYGLFVEELKNGPTTRACIFATTHVPATLRLMDLLEESGLSTLVGKVSMDRDCPGDIREETAQALGAVREWLERSKEYQRTRPILTPRFIPSCTDPLLEGLGRLQKETGLPVQSHLSENPGEIELVKSLCPWAQSYGHAYDRFGLFGGEGCPTVMAHCVHSAPAEVELMAERGVFVAHCPQSNANLASGIAPVRAYLDRGIPVGMGTDVAGGHSLSMFRAVTDAVQVSKLRWRLTDSSLAPLTFPEALWLATRGGGAFFGKVGALEPGYAADLLVLDDSGLPAPRELSPEERLERIFYLGDDRNVRSKYVAGRKMK